SDDEAAKQLAHVEGLTQWHRDGKPLISTEQARKALAVQALQEASSSQTPVEAIRRVRRVFDAARRIGDELVADEMAGLIAGLRDSMLAGRTADLSRHLTVLTEWASMKVPLLTH